MSLGIQMRFGFCKAGKLEEVQLTIQRKLGIKRRCEGKTYGTLVMLIVYTKEAAHSK